MERLIIERFENDLVLYLTREQGPGWSAVALDKADQVRIGAQLPTPVSVPEWAVRSADGDPPHLSVDAVGEEIARRGEQARAELIAALRPLESVQVTWGESSTFLDLSTATRGEIRLPLADWLQGNSSRIGEFSLHSTLQLQGDPALPSLQVSSSLCCVLYLNRPALLRVDLDELNFAFPEFEFPSLDLGDTLAWPGDVGSSPLLERLGKLGGSLADTVKVAVVATSGAPHLAIDLANGKVRWALVDSADALDWTNIEPRLARFDVTISQGAATLSIAELRVANTGDGLWLKHKDPSGALRVRSGDVAQQQFGPLGLKADDVTVDLLWDGANRCLLADVTFERLQLRLVDDPQTFISLSGQVQFTASASRLVSLKLVEPYPLDLLADAGAALLRGVGNVISFLATLDSPDVTPPRLTRLLEILGRFATALAKAALFVGQALVSALDALAEGICALLGQLSNPFALSGPGAPSLPLRCEVRIGLAPLQLRQVLIMRREPLSGAQRCTAAGLELTLHKDWQPGLLLDLVDNPGAYLLLSHATPAAKTAIADLGTDLWLEDKDTGSAGHMPDASSDDGGRADTRIISLKTQVSPRLPNQRLDVVLVGVERGRAVFLKRLEGSLRGISAGVATVAEPWRLTPLDLDADVEFAKERLLPLLGMGEPGIGAQPDGFLDKLKDSFAQVVWVEGFTSTYQAATREVDGKLALGIKAAGVRSRVELGLILALDTLRVRLRTPKGAGLKSRRIVERALGLTWIIEQRDENARAKDEEVEMFTLSFLDGESGLALNPEEARMTLRFEGLSSGDDGILFEVSTFFVGRRGIDISAAVADSPVRINGLDVPFRFHQGRFEMRAGQLQEATVSGRGKLPPALIGDAECSLDLAFLQEGGSIVLRSGKVTLDKKGEAIVCHATRFTLVITDLDLGIQKDGGYHLYLLVTGSLRFTPKAGEFEGGLLGFLKDIEINLERTPLTGDARVLARHVSFQKALNPKKSFSLFNLFTFELRGFGFHPSAERFDGAPAINLSGQIKFAEIGDVMQPKIDFHGLWIAPPANGEALPRISAEGLGLDLQLAGSVKVRGAVLAVDPSTRTVEGRQFAPDGYNTYGFLGEGEVEIPGWGAMQASLGFLEVERKDVPGLRRKAFFVYLQKDKLAVEVPTGFWNFYMREAGMGFGFRYTLSGIRDADEAKTPAQLIRVLDDVSKRQGDLGRFAAWTPDPDGDRFTLALRAALQSYPAKKAWIEKEEEKAENPFFFDMIVALRSDLTLLASLRGWLGVNYADFRANKDNFRERPGLRGYLYISAPRSELLARMIGDSKGFIGERFEGLRTDQPLRRAVESVDWSATLYIRPGLFHYELGWPDQLAVRLVDEANMKVSLRGGMIFRAADDGLVWGYNIEADAWLAFGGSAGSGSIGVALEATLQARFVARLIAYLSWRFSGSMVYGLVMLDASLTFRVRAWMEVDLGFKSFTLRIGFSYSVQFSAAIEMAVTTSGVAGRGNARLAISAFGCTLGVGIGFAFNAGELDAARAQVQRFLAMSISADQPDLPPAAASKDGDQRINDAAQVETLKAKPVESQVVKREQSTNESRPDLIYPEDAGWPIGKTTFWLVLYRAVSPDGEDYAYGLLVPKEASHPRRGGFYASPPCQRDLRPGFSYRLNYCRLDNLRDVRRLGPDGLGESLDSEVEYVGSRWTSQIPIDTPGVEFRLDQLFDECFLTDTSWRQEGSEFWRQALRRQEPKRPRQYRREAAKPSRDEADRAAQRDLAQREHLANAARHPADDRVWQARSTAMSMFLDQFVTFASGTPRTSLDEAHVLDLGLMFHGPAAQLEALAEALTVHKYDQSPRAAARVEVFNPVRSWFQHQDPIFAGSRLELGANGMCMDWDLSLPWLEAIHPDPDQFLHHYEIRRTIEGREYQPRLVRVKPAATFGAVQEKEKDLDHVAVHPADWQYVDDFSDLSAEWRRALLPTTNEADALLATQAWTKLEIGSDDVTFTWSVTPVDIAGTRGLSKSFLHVFERPRPPVRAAQAEVRVVQTLRSNPALTPADRDLCWQTRATSPDDLAVYIAVHDPAWQARKDLKATRSYTLIVEQELILPAGAYAAGGATDKVRGLGSAGAQATAPALRFEIPFAELLPLAEANDAQRAAVEALERDADTRQRFELWGALTPEVGWSQKLLSPARRAELRKALWVNQDGQRVAARFWLRTDITLADGVRLSSQLVAVPCELTIKHLYGERLAESTSLRPEVFEWPLHLRLPPLPQHRLRVRSGFLHLRMPVPGASLGQWAARDQRCIEVQRDSARRSAVHLEFDALAQWAREVVDPLHQTSIAGFDLHELDLDDLAPLDTHAQALEDSLLTWERARRIAHIELLAPEEASLVPSNNADWLGWQAHYPSESWRALPRPGQGATAPRRAWYSARESTPGFAKRLPRQRLLLQAPESAIIELLRKGWPDSIKARLTIAIDSPASRTLKDISASLRVGLCTPVVELAGAAAPGTFFALDKEHFSLRQPGQFSASVVRYLLLSLCLQGLDDESAEVKTWQRDPGALDGLNLELSAHLGKELLTSVPVALDFRSPLHPLLEETLAELALRDRQGEAIPQVYRAYNVMLQAPAQVEGSELAAWLAATPPASDPYGWGVLQALGLAATVRLYHLGEGRFLRPVEVAARVDAVFSAVFERWRGRLGTSCQPFAEVLLKPGANRVVRPFDAVSTASTASKAFEIDDDGLALIQLSLRPVPEAIWDYRLLTFDAAEACRERLDCHAGSGGQWSLQRMSLWLKRAHGDTSQDEIDLLDPATGLGVTLGRKDPQVELRLAQSTLGQHRLVVRCPAGRTDLVGFKIRYGLQVTITQQGGRTFEKTVYLTVRPSRCKLRRSPRVTLAGLDVFELFPMQNAKAWAQQMGTEQRRLGTLLAHLRAVAPNFAEPKHYDDDTWTSLMGQYTAWAQRLLDHAAAPGPGLAGTSSINLALAAPSRTNPLRLAADGAGCVRLYIPSDDRWGHARAYALRPVSRYAHLMAGVGLLPAAEREQLVTEDMRKQPVGHAIAVVPRTERIEPPVILGSSIQHETWELILARHGEESLAASNRPLFARLGKPDVLLSQLRAYRTPTWPQKLVAEYRIDAPELYPQRLAEHPQRPAQWDDLGAVAPAQAGEVRRLTPTRLGEMATTRAGLWKGAEVLNFPAIAPQYKVLAVAAARAGIVVSELVSALQDDLPRRSLRTLDSAQALLPTLSLVPGAHGETLYRLSHRLLSHHDLTPEVARERRSGGPQDVCWWPDPDISYQLHFQASSAGMRLSEELSDTRLVAEDATTAAVAVRCRGARWTTADSLPRIDSNPVPRAFQLVVDFRPLAAWRATLALAGRPEYDAPFEQAIVRFARVLRLNQRYFALQKAATETDVDYAARIVAFPEACKALASRLEASARFDSGELLDDCRMAGERVARWLEQNGGAVDWPALFSQAVAAGALADLDAPALRCWPRPDPALPEWDPAPLYLRDADMADILCLWDIPVDREIDAIVASGHALAAQGSRFWQLLVQRLNGGSASLELRAIDARANWSAQMAQHPGVMAVAVQWPKLVKMIQ
ncbi:hypothetical protein [Pseudomonas sp. zfem002]|uniref:hypothetical protein n=1 Tax=Pseudomonas sp. zfem002 TaxID=3078197 RepID=UPI00292A02C9|nr:hypothetical protein [Pseudomonas sp. zfem002]MDU9393321.1 hypothetical protein [Pseudomonas sp. zfem002]